MSTVHLGTAYQREIYTDFVTDSGFLVLAKGLGLFQIVKALVELYASPKMLVFLLGATPAQEAVLQHLFTGGEEQLVGHVNFKILKNDTPSKNRYGGLQLIDV
ncbi:DNA repair endonuclease XPF [Paramicrosporidium saccamoebae]|uniref:DNA repair endonuclease XPF n=1 Tax=Paramicrosporidium saccamoebae TaxID=1246581 RepID=A0A2H9TL44_9FUNG|nr:DNA repair endonuclease XPF [Paramicrosporidium saccamoebae]